METTIKLHKLKTTILKIVYLFILFFIGINANDITNYIMDNKIDSFNIFICVICILMEIKGILVASRNDTSYIKWLLPAFIISLSTLFINLILF